MEQENFKPERKEIDLTAHVSKLPSGGNMEISEITIPADTELVGVFDGLFERSLKRPTSTPGRW